MSAEDNIDVPIEFSLAEYNSLRREIEIHLQVMDRTSQLAVFASAVVFVYALQSYAPGKESGLFAVIYLIPTFISVVAMRYYYSLRGIIRMIADYLYLLEEKIGAQSGGNEGWHHFLALRDNKRKSIRFSGATFWIMVVAFNFLFGSYLTWRAE